MKNVHVFMQRDAIVLMQGVLKDAGAKFNILTSECVVRRMPGGCRAEKVQPE